MKETRFELRKNSIEISYKNRMDIKEGCTLDQDEQEPIVIKSFANKEAALNELKNYETEIAKLSSGAGTYYSVEEYYVEENTYDEEEEFIDCFGVWRFSKIEITVIEKPSYEEVGTYDNFSDAEEKLYNLDEGYLIF